MVESNDISVVVQGAIDKENTVSCIASVRKYLPQAEIVLSTWKGSNIVGLDYDILVENNDPGSSDLIRLYPFEHQNNINRQIISTRNGILKCSRKYVLKLRTDMILKGNRLLKYYDLFGQIKTRNTIFKQRIAVNAATTPDISLFNVGDWWSFGLKEDMLMLWDIPLYPDKRGGEYFLKKENTNKKPQNINIVCRFIPEIWIIYSCYKKFYQINLEHMWDFRDDNLDKSKKFIRNNFLSVENCFSDIYLPKALNYTKAQPSKEYYNHKKQLKFFYHETERNILSKFEKLKLSIINNTSKMYEKHLQSLLYIYVVRNYAQPKNLITLNSSKIKEEDVSFVISGLIDRKAIKNIKKVKKLYPQAKIILSLQTGTDISKLDGFYDKVIFTDLQKNYYLDWNCHKDNSFFKRFTFNKQQTEIYKGLQEVQTKYAVRLRSDFALNDSKLIQRFEQFASLFPKTLADKHIFKHKILVPNIITGCECFSPFYLSDLFAFGLTDDMKKLYHGGLVCEDKLKFFLKKENADLNNPANFSHQYANEQSFFFNLLKKCNVNFDYPDTYCSYTTEQALAYNKIITNNFIVVPFEMLNIKTKFPQEWGISYSKFVELYMLNVDPKNTEFDKYLLRIKNIEKLKPLKHKYLVKLKKHFLRFLKPFINVFKWIWEPVTIVINIIRYFRVLLKILLNKIVISKT